MDRRMLTQMICRQLGNYHTGVSGCPYLTPVFEGLRLIMATSAPFSILFVRQVFTLNKQNDGTESTW